MKLKKRIAALLMAGVMVCSILPVNALAVESSNQNVGGLCEHHTEHNADCGYTEVTEGTPCGYVCEICKGEQTEQARTTTIVGFDELAPEVAEQTVQPGTALEDLNLPDTLGASAYMAEDDTQPITIEGVTWEPDGPYDPTAEVDGYLFAPVLPEGYVLAEGVELPEIAVMVLAADNAIVPMADVEEQFDGILTPGSTYWFDLSGAGIPGTKNQDLPDGSLHWVPFTYVGTINAYSRNSEGVSTDDTVNPYDHSLFIADYNVTRNVRWNQLNDKQMIFGTPYTSYGVNYTMRAPSVGSQLTGDGDSMRGTPQSNEWDAILDKADQGGQDNTTGYIKNWLYIPSYGQDSFTRHDGVRAGRGGGSAREWTGILATDIGFRFRPVFELPAPDTLSSDSLKVVTLDLDGGKVGMTDTTVNIVVKTDENFAAPSGEGLTGPDGREFMCWQGSDGKTYKEGDSIPSTVTSLTAHWKPMPTVTSPAANTLTYTGSAQELVSEGSTNGGTLQYSLEKQSGYSTDIPKGTNAGDYKVWYKVVGDDNYADVAPQSIDVTIDPKPITGANIDFVGSNYTYTGQAVQPNVSVTLDNKTLTAGTDYTLSYSNSNGGDGNLTNAGTVTVNATGKGNYTGTASGTFTIDKATPTPDLPTGLTATYGDALANVKLPAGWKWDAPNTSVGNVGENSFSATYTPTDTSNYNTATATLTVTVKAVQALPLYGRRLCKGASVYLSLCGWRGYDFPDHCPVYNGY